ncbi:thioredoxin-related protein [Catalinimonas alkaloidigena]|uniref:thioredoxin family protein n=1 Tax=Catalinimonas alkaloidigena TaxID=1075417 RepID=UPI002404CD82|nr:thioredoxin family protein [Catalinimonas alkaloidigena]MDF9795448.1 thioredoxin-related protein [Catalinimonas alkaloidigena]
MVRVFIGLLWIWFGSTQLGYGQAGSAFSFQQLDSLQQIEERPVLVFIHTDWCRYCQNMKHTTFQDETVRARLESAFYFISLDAESKQDIMLQGQAFQYRPTGNGTGQHELAQLLGNVEGKLSFPTLCFLNADYEIIYQRVGFVSAKQLRALLKILIDEKEEDAYAEYE